MRKPKTPKSVCTRKDLSRRDDKEFIDGPVTVLVNKTDMYTNLYDASHRLQIYRYLCVQNVCATFSGIKYACSSSQRVF
jgi:hypothetical protein